MGGNRQDANGVQGRWDQVLRRGDPRGSWIGAARLIPNSKARESSCNSWLKLVNPIGSVGRKGLRAVGTRERAQVFISHDEAARAIDTLSQHFAALGVQFSIE